MIHDILKLIETWIIPEPIIVKMRLINLDRTSLITHHEFLEG